MSIIVRSDGPTRRDTPALEPLYQRRFQPRRRGDSIPAMLGQAPDRAASLEGSAPTPGDR